MNHGVDARLVDDLTRLPHHSVGVVLGCVPRLRDGRNNLYFRYRMEAAARLFHAGKVNHLLVSGDNHRRGYDEPTAMRDALIALGVPAARIILDYAGFRTLDSVVRAKEVFGQDRIVIVSQRFHNQRALYLALASGVNAMAYNARDVVGSEGNFTGLREPLARIRAVLDVHLLRTRPRFTGPRVVIGAASSE
ncbi:MAG: ElyC/SanA/YdcF family protein [Polyangiaceae bacterium]